MEGDFAMQIIYECTLRVSAVEFVENLVAEHIRLNEHARHMERTFEDVTLGRLSHRAVAMQIAVPFAVLVVGEVSVGPVANHAVAFDEAFVAGGEVGVERRCLLYTSPSPRDSIGSRMPSSA